MRNILMASVISLLEDKLFMLEFATLFIAQNSTENLNF